MATKRRIQSAGLVRAEAHALAQAEQLRADSDPTTVMPAMDSSPEAWAGYVNAARGRAVEAVIEWGNRIRQAHDAYRAQGQQWGRTWDDWCQEHLGIRRSFSHKLMLIAENLCPVRTQILPPSTEALHALARVRRDAPAIFEAKISSGEIHPEMSRQEVRTILVQAQAVDEQPRPTSRKSTRSLRISAELLGLLEQKAASRGLTLVELLETVALEA